MLILRLSGEVGWDITPSDVQAKLDSASEDITVHLFTPGGNVFDGVEIHNMFKAYTGGKVIFIAGAEVCSIGAYIALAGDELHVHDNSAFMIHSARGGIYGDAKAMRQRADIIDMINGIQKDRYVSKSNFTREEITPLLDTDTYFFGQAIMDAGFADKLIESGTTAKKDDLLIAAKAHTKECTENCHIRPKKDIKGFVEALSADMIKNEFVDEANEILEKYNDN